MKLWNKGIKLKTEIEKFTVGNDYLLDMKLLKYDCLASIAHAKMLRSINILTEEELLELIEGLNEIIQAESEGKFEIKLDDEDCHTAIENFLVQKVGDAGKKIHTLRSRNDQVLTALRLYEKNELNSIKELGTQFIVVLNEVINKFGSVKMPGYTHMQKAMPTDVKTWLGSYKDSMTDNLILLDAVYILINQNTLGSAAGFGVPVFEIDKNLTTQELGFSKTMNNSMYCQLSRGKFEAQILNVLTMIMFDLNKLSMDLMLFSMKEFNYVELPTEFCMGSSIMPQKKNPDVLELLRAKYYVVLGEEFKIKNIVGSLISGYNRDVQLTKEPLMKSIEITKDSLQIISLILADLKINKLFCEHALTEEIYATKKAYELVKSGMSFRDAYREVGKNYK